MIPTNEDVIRQVYAAAEAKDLRPDTFVSLFADDGYAHVPLLAPEDAGKYRAYRAAYASILESWCLWAQRYEILKFNGEQSVEHHVHVPDKGIQYGTDGLRPSKSFDDAMSQTTLTLGKIDSRGSEHTARPQDEPVKQLVIAGRCPKCREAMLKTGGKTRCSGCNAGMKVASCSVCLEPVASLYRACLGCGHLAHTGCLETMIEGLRASMARGDSAGMVFICEAGCGCACERRKVLQFSEMPT